jgi:hypothetical protein
VGEVVEALGVPDQLPGVVNAGAALQPLTVDEQAFVEGVDARRAAPTDHDELIRTCRHTAASFMLAAGTPNKVMAELLGHSSPTITLEIYVAVLPGMAEQAGADLSASLLSGGTNRANQQLTSRGVGTSNPLQYSSSCRDLNPGPLDPQTHQAQFVLGCRLPFVPV